MEVEVCIRPSTDTGKKELCPRGTSREIMQPIYTRSADHCAGAAQGERGDGESDRQK